MKPRWWNRRPRTSIGLVIAALLSLWILRGAGTALVVSRDVGAPDAIVALASHEWERLPEAARLARTFPSSVVLLTVPRVVTRYNCHDCAGRAGWLQQAGVSPERIIQLGDLVTSTRDEAMAVRRFAAGRRMGTLTIVTSPYHSRRALSVFEQALAGTGIRIGVSPALSTSPADPAHWWWHPYDRWYVRYEWAALIYYSIRFRLPI